jgi:uncharacterized protein (TIGR03435 family)
LRSPFVKLGQEDQLLSTLKYMIFVVSALTYAQTGSRPAFEVASVKPSQSAEPARLTSNPGTWSCTNCRLFDLFGHAYKVFEYQIVAPEWTKAATFDVVAKLPPGVAPGPWNLNVNEDPFALMMQSLLEERFKSTVHREKRELPVYELIIAKGGHKLKEVTEPAPALPSGPPVDKDGFPNVPGGNGMRLLRDRGRIQFQQQRMVHIAHFISTQVDRPVLDATGLSGRYALTLSWFRAQPATAPLSTGTVPAPSELSPGPTIFEAVQDQLGLKLQPTKSPIEVVVIDHIEKKPTEN